MKTTILCAVLAVWSLGVFYGHAQETENSKTIQQLTESKEKVISVEKEALKNEVEAINIQLENDEITYADSEKLKKETAEKHALNIENQLAILDNQIAYLERNKGSLDDSRNYIALNLGKEKGNNEDVIFGIHIKNKNKDLKYDRRTSNSLVYAFGLNNTIIDGQSLDDSPYSIGNSGFQELGWAWKTRVFKNSNFLRVKYGFSFQWNKLEVKDDLYFVDNGDLTSLEEFPSNLNKAELRITNLVFPLHLEFGPSKKVEHKNYFRYSTVNQFKFGVGGFAGFNIGSQQKLKYKEDGDRVKQKIKRDYNTTNFVYGMSAYVGFDVFSLYAKYDLSPLFKDQPVKQNNISLGLRLDLD